MQIINIELLNYFIVDHPDSRSSILSWVRETGRVVWTNPNQVKNSFGSASHVGKLTVFNISGNKYRLITEIGYQVGSVVVDQIITHAQYDLNKWKR